MTRARVLQWRNLFMSRTYKIIILEMAHEVVQFCKELGISFGGSKNEFVLSVARILRLVN